MNLFRALRFDQLPRPPVAALCGSGGKTTALFQIARGALNTDRKRVIVASTTHLGVWQVALADHHIAAKDKTGLSNLPSGGVILVAGELDGDRIKPVNETVLYALYERSAEENIPLFIEADGSRQKPLKAPAAHEPPIPDFVELVIYVAGMSGLGQPLDDEHVHRAEIFSQLSGLPLGEPVTTGALLAYLTHPQGALKNIPREAKRIVLLNQAETPEMRSIGGGMARALLKHFDSVLAGSLSQGSFHAVERAAGIILAAGMSSRFGQPKQLLDWNGKSFVRHVTETALRSALEPVAVVTGFHHAEIESRLLDLPIERIYNPNYAQGQSTSIRAGLAALPRNIGAAVFLLADQPQISAEIIRALVETHAAELPPILAPLVLGERRANPVLFDQAAFPDLMQLQGDVGGRAIFNRHKVSHLPWHDDSLLFDVDKPEDYERLLRLGV